MVSSKNLLALGVIAFLALGGLRLARGSPVDSIPASLDVPAEPTPDSPVIEEGFKTTQPIVASDMERQFFINPFTGGKIFSRQDFFLNPFGAGPLKASRTGNIIGRIPIPGVTTLEQLNLFFSDQFKFTQFGEVA